MMRVSTWLSLVGIGLLLMGLVAGCASYSSGGGNPHVAEAVMHAQEAVEHGNIGHADAAATHAEVDRQHAQAAAKEMSNPHLDTGIAELGGSYDPWQSRSC